MCNVYLCLCKDLFDCVCFQKMQDFLKELIILGPCTFLLLEKVENEALNMFPDQEPFIFFDWRFMLPTKINRITF